MTTQEADTVEYCGDADLGYEHSRTRFAPGEGLSLDERYRLAHLPLVAPDHPRIITTRAGTDYDRGRHARTVSLVMPVPWRDLFAAEAYRALEEDLRASPLAPRIAWDLVERRRERLHATICGSLPLIGSNCRSVMTKRQRRQLAEIGPVKIELRGLFSGNVNVGRVYLRVHPERRGGMNTFKQIQRVLNWEGTDLYLVGLYNLTSDLTPLEAWALESILDRCWHRPILRLEIEALWLLWATDDLVLGGGVDEVVPLRAFG